jgi:CHAT domain-containing protein
MLLGPVADRLDKKRLLIVADGALQYIPFGALPPPQKDYKSHALIIDYEIVNLPSASSLAMLRREFAGRQPAAGMVAILADPVLQSDDTRVRQAGAQAKTEAVAANGDLLRSATDVGIMSFPRLQATRREAEAILALAAEGKNLKALDFEASRATAGSPDLADYRIVHFATHGLINNQRPQLSGIVLSLVDEQGRSQDGFLRAHDIYNLRFGADLIVLSACRTALGEEVKGEGLVGLTQAFMYAGAPRVVASLWNVQDRATAELMTRFYEKMLKEGMPPAAALRAAQVSMLKQARWKAPYYWAGFLLQGEWN